MCSEYFWLMPNGDSPWLACVSPVCPRVYEQQNSRSDVNNKALQAQKRMRDDTYMEIKSSDPMQWLNIFTPIANMRELTFIFQIKEVIPARATLVSNQRHTSELLPGLSEQNWLADRNVSLRAPNVLYKLLAY